MVAETGAGAEEVAGAFIVARDVSNAREPWDAVEKLDRVVPNDVQADLMKGVDSMVEQLARWYLTHVPHIDLRTEVELAQAPFAELVACMGDVATTAWRLSRDERLEHLLEQDVARDAARFAAIAPDLVYAPDIITVAAHLLALDRRRRPRLLRHRRAPVPGRDRAAGVASSRPRRAGSGSRGRRSPTTCGCCAARSPRPCWPRPATPRSTTRSTATWPRRTDPYERLASLMTTLAAAPGDDASVIMVAVHQIRQVIA